MSDNAKDKLILPVYINEKTVIDMLAILEDGFSMVSQVNYTESQENGDSKKVEANVSTSSTLFSKLLKIDISGEFNAEKRQSTGENVSKEKVHTIVSLFAKVRNYLVENKLLKSNFNISNIQIGDFIELEGELQKNPLINYFDSFLDLYRMANIFSEKSNTTGGKQSGKGKSQKEDPILRQIKSFIGELKHSGTMDFILSDEKGTAILSVQEQYLSIDNISELLVDVSKF